MTLNICLKKTGDYYITSKNFAGKLVILNDHHDDVPTKTDLSEVGRCWKKSSPGMDVSFYIKTLKKYVEICKNLLRSLEICWR